MLKVNDHSRDSAGLRYVYPVVSRRAGGVSVGINLNVNNACNWACVYCQVPNLTRGGPPPVDLDLLRRELSGFLRDAIQGDFMARCVPLEARQLVDVAFSGNGEPTSAAEFDEAVECVEAVLREEGLAGVLELRLITNGSLVHRPAVQRGLARIGQLNGEVWFKLDSATEDGVNRINGIRLAPDRVLAAVRSCAALAPTWIQTCFFATDGREVSEAEQLAYLQLIESVREIIKGVHLYGLARPSLQPRAEHLSRVEPEAIEAFADRLRALGVCVSVSP